MRSWITRHYGVWIVRWLYGRPEPSYEVTFNGKIPPEMTSYTYRKASR